MTISASVFVAFMEDKVYGGLLPVIPDFPQLSKPFVFLLF